MLENEQIKKIMRDAGLTQTDMANKLGITQSAFSYMLNSKNRLRPKTLKRIAIALGFTENFFIDGTKNEDLLTRISILEKSVEELKKQIALLKKEK